MTYTTDPFGEAIKAIHDALENALDDGVSGSMSPYEHDILEKIAVIVTQEAGMNVEPRPA